MSLTTRQSQILKAIIEEYIECATPIASVELVHKRQIPLSGATVRNIMSDLVRKGYLKMQHVSSGRLPTELAYRYYISELMDEPDISVLEELTIKQLVWDNRYELERLLRSATQALSETTKLLAMSLNEDGYIYHFGSSRILDEHEFLELDVAKTIFRLLDDYNLARSVFEKVPLSQGVSVLIGREIGIANLEPVSMIFVNKKIDNKNCSLGVIGPSRARYYKVIPIVRYISSLFDDINDSL